MEFVFEPELLALMEKKNKKNILVEVISSDSSDFDLTELYVRLVSDRLARVYLEDRGFREMKTEKGSVLLPKYRLEYAETVTFGIKKRGPFKKVVQTGIAL